MGKEWGGDCNLSKEFRLWLQGRKVLLDKGGSLGERKGYLQPVCGGLAKFIGRPRENTTYSMLECLDAATQVNYAKEEPGSSKGV